jgi:hypothetical protein
VTKASTIESAEIESDSDFGKLTKNLGAQTWYYNSSKCKDQMLKDLFAYMKPHKLYDCTKTSDKIFEDTSTESEDSLVIKPSAVVEIISIPSVSLQEFGLMPAMIVTLFENGRCAIWAKETHTVVFLNKSPDE